MDEKAPVTQGHEIADPKLEAAMVYFGVDAVRDSPNFMTLAEQAIAEKGDALRDVELAFYKKCLALGHITDDEYVLLKLGLGFEKEGENHSDAEVAEAGNFLRNEVTARIPSELKDEYERLNAARAHMAHEGKILSNHLISLRAERERS